MYFDSWDYAYFLLRRSLFLFIPYKVLTYTLKILSLGKIGDSDLIIVMRKQQPALILSAPADAEHTIV